MAKPSVMGWVPGPCPSPCWGTHHQGLWAALTIPTFSASPKANTCFYDHPLAAAHSLWSSVTLQIPARTAQGLVGKYLYQKSFGCKGSFLYPEKELLKYCFHVCGEVLTGSDSFMTSWTVALQAPLSMGFSRQGYWSGVPFLPPGDLLDSGIEPVSLALQANSLPLVPPS